MLHLCSSFILKNISSSFPLEPVKTLGKKKKKRKKFQMLPRKLLYLKSVGNYCVLIYSVWFPREVFPLDKVRSHFSPTGLTT